MEQGLLKVLNLKNRWRKLSFSCAAVHFIMSRQTKKKSKLVQILHYIDKNLCTWPSKPIFFLVSLCFYNNHYSSEKVFHYNLKHGFVDFFSHLSTRAVIRQDAHQVCSSSSQRCSLWLRSKLYAGHWSSSTPALANHVFINPDFCSEALSGWNRFGLLSSSEGIKGIEDNLVLPTLCLQFRGESHMAVKVRCL